MKKGKILLILIGIILFIMVLFGILKIFIKNETEIQAEITPMEEMTDEQERQTIISLYYMNVETNTLMPEARVIDAKNLLENPYKTLIECLLVTPKNEKLKSVIPEGTKVNEAILEGDLVTVDLSKEFIDNRLENDKIYLSIYAIINTLTELNEVQHVKILVDGEERQFFDENGVLLNNILTR